MLTVQELLPRNSENHARKFTVNYEAQDIAAGTDGASSASEAPEFPRVVDILVVEDCDSERDSIVNALESAITGVRIAVARDSSEALDFVFCRGAWSDRRGEDPPKLILMDLELKGSDGFSVLGQIRSIEPEEALTLTPVVIFTDSQDTGDVKKSYRCGANSYIIKPLSFPDFNTVVQTVGQYWMSHNRIA